MRQFELHLPELYRQLVSNLRRTNGCINKNSCSNNFLFYYVTSTGAIYDIIIINAIPDCNFVMHLFTVYLLRDRFAKTFVHIIQSMHFECRVHLTMHQFPANFVPQVMKVIVQRQILSIIIHYTHMCLFSYVTQRK